MNTTMHNSICDWTCESSPTSLSEPDDNELDIGFGGQLNYGLKLEDGFELAEPLLHHSPGHFHRDELNLSLNTHCNRRPKLEPTAELESHPMIAPPAQNNSPDAQMDIYRDLILRHLIQDIATTCSKLALPTDPTLWTIEHTMNWVKEMCEQFSICAPLKITISGKQMMEMSVEEFCFHMPEGGDTLHAQFQLWKTAFESHTQQRPQFQPHSIPSVALVNKTWDVNSIDSEAAAPATINIHTNIHGSSPIMATENLHPNYYANFAPRHHQPAGYSLSMVNQQPIHYNQMPQFQCGDSYYTEYTNSHVLASPSQSDISSSSSMVDEDPMDARFMGFEQTNRLVYENSLQNVAYLDMSYGQNVMNQQVNGTFPSLNEGTPTGYAGNNAFSKSSSGSIHLWHFIRELLDQPKEYSSCVRWVDRSEGTFKIESSHNLARYWGLRKNRSQMNYDKLSRSLRQYYKKGIIQKPEKKQRLVYKFLPPYNH